MMPLAISRRSLATHANGCTMTHRLRFLVGRSAFFSTASAVPEATSSSWGTSSTTNAATTIELKKIPTLPLFGSMVPAYSGLPPMDMSDMNNWNRRVYRENGPFFSMGIPGFGSGWHGTVHVVQDPNEMLRLIKQEGSYPSGIVEKEWPMKLWFDKRKHKAAALFDHGEEWKRLRNFMQKDLLSPASAREYLPGIIRGARIASQRVPHFVPDNKILQLLNYATMDMFTQVLFGGDDGISKEDYDQFCWSAVDGISEMMELMLFPSQIFACHWMGFQTSKLRRFMEHMDLLDDIAHERFRNFVQRAKKNDLSEDEKNSYFYKMMQRQPDSDVTMEEAMGLAVVVMMASVDTTASKIAWSVLQLALHPEIQQDLYEQLHRAVQKEGGRSSSGSGGLLTAAVLERTEVPLLPALIRETHRCTPPIFGDIVKKVESPATIHGVTLPAGSTIMFDSITKMWDPAVVDDPMRFAPERWFKEAVESRRNTPQAIVDHPFYSGPFSQGARRCPGSRVANLEEQALIAQLVLDWKIEGPRDVHWKDVPGKMQGFFVPDFPTDIRFVPRRSSSSSASSSA